MGDAFVAISDDGTAASWNPAGLAQLRQPELSLVYSITDRGVDFSALRSPDQRIAYSNQRFAYSSASPEFASAALPFSIARRPVTLQAGWQRVYQLSSEISGTVQRVETGGASSTVLRNDHLVGDIDVLSLAGAVKLSSRLAIGASVDWWRGGWKEHFAITEPSTATSESAFVSGDVQTDLSGENFTVGLLLTYPSWTAAAVYHSPSWLDFRVRNHSSATGVESNAFDVPARFHWPRSIAAGLSRRFATRWTATAALTQDQWTGALIEGDPGTEGPVNFFDEAPPSLSTTRDTTSFNVGLERLFVRDGAVVPLRLGAGWEPQGSMDPVARDPVAFGLVSAGGGYNTNRIKFDAAVQYRWGNFGITDVVSVATALAGNPARDADGRAGTHEWRIKLSAIYRIQDTEKLRGILHKIFG